MKNLKNLLFISIVSIICVLLLTFFYQLAKPKIEENESFDVVMNVLYTFDIPFDSKQDRYEIKQLFDQHIVKRDIQGLPYYQYGKGKNIKYGFPFIAKGLWGMIYGFISLENDLKTVFRVTFSKQEETPGLGARIEEKTYKEQYTGQSLYSKNNLFGLISRKSADPKAINTIDAITGATITSTGVINGINETLEKYIDLLKGVKQ